MRAEDLVVVVVVDPGQRQLETWVLGREGVERAVGIDDLGADAVGFLVSEPERNVRASGPVHDAAHLFVVPPVAVHIIFFERVGRLDTGRALPLDDDVTLVVPHLNAGGTGPVLGGEAVVDLLGLVQVRVC